MIIFYATPEIFNTVYLVIHVKKKKMDSIVLFVTNLLFSFRVTHRFLININLKKYTIRARLLKIGDNL